jgi:hypothetical protein
VSWERSLHKANWSELSEINQNSKSNLVKVKVKVILRPTVCRPVRLGIRHPPGTRDQFFPFSLWLFFFLQFRVCWCGAPFLTRSRICTFNAGHRQSSLSQIWVPRDLCAQFIVSICETPLTRRARFLYLFKNRFHLFHLRAERQKTQFTVRTVVSVTCCLATAVVFLLA